MKRRRDGSFEKVNPDGTRSIVWGIASTGQVAPTGTVEQVDHASGRQDAIVRPAPASLGVRSGDFVREDFTVNLADLEKRLTEALKAGTVRYERQPDGSAVVNFDDFKRWVNTLT